MLPLDIRELIGFNWEHNKQVPSHVLMGWNSASASSLTPFGDACSRKDLTAVHEMLEDLGYKDDEGVANEVCNLYTCVD